MMKPVAGLMRWIGRTREFVQFYSCMHTEHTLDGPWICIREHWWELYSIMELLNAVHWVHTRKGQKAFLPFSTNPPKFPLKKIHQEAKEVKTCLSAPHTVKGFADDMTVISPNISAHSSALKIIDQKASSLDLKLKPEKCVSFLYDGKDIDKRSTFSLSHGFYSQHRSSTLEGSWSYTSSFSNWLPKSICQEAGR